ncbi:MAG: universal stress protein [Opitutales bacterium]|nr:universal stress protein [Opitutales bacterium]NRA27090.1 universal stress protein [Opitutales bacterium]
MKHLLLCVDGSHYTQPACAYAAWWATVNDADIHTVYVSDLHQFEAPVFADLSGSLGIQPYQGIIPQIQEMEKQKAKIISNAVTDFLDAADFPEDRRKFEHRTGFIVDTVEEMQSLKDLIVAGKRGEHADFASGHLGSKMERIVRASHVPVLVTSREFQAVSKVLFAYDGSKSGEKALLYIRDNAMFRDAELHVVSVAEKGHSERYAGYLRDAERELKNAGLSPICQALGGEPEDMIASYVEQQSIDLMMMGAYGHSRIRHLLIGSTTTEMIRRCRIPVLCFR